MDGAVTQKAEASELAGQAASVTDGKEQADLASESESFDDEDVDKLLNDPELEKYMQVGDQGSKVGMQGCHQKSLSTFYSGLRIQCNPKVSKCN